MKKFMFAAMAAMAITSCSQNEEFDAVSQKSVIGFNTAVSKTTRAAITDDVALQGSGFKVYAYTSTEEISDEFPATTTELMKPATVTYNTGWTVDSEYYWPLKEKVHFYAFADKIDGLAYVAAEASKYPGLTYTIQDAAADQKDLVLAKLENQTKSNNAIALDFIHALTQVNFSAQGDKSGFTYTVNSIKIENVAKTGTYSFGTDKWVAEGSLTASYEYPINQVNKNVIGTTKQNLDVTNNTLMLMPQAMNADSKIVISYSVSNGKDLIYETPAEGITISLNGKTAWEAGKKIRYSLTLANGAVTMNFSPTVGNWGGAEGTEGGEPLS